MHNNTYAILHYFLVRYNPFFRISVPNKIIPGGKHSLSYLPGIINKVFRKNSGFYEETGNAVLIIEIRFSSWFPGPG